MIVNPHFGQVLSSDARTFSRLILLSNRSIYLKTGFGPLHAPQAVAHDGQHYRPQCRAGIPRGPWDQYLLHLILLGLERAPESPYKDGRFSGLRIRVYSRFPSVITFQRTSRSRAPTASFFLFRSRTRPGGRFGHSVPNIHFEDTAVDLNYYNRGR